MNLRRPQAEDDEQFWYIAQFVLVGHFLYTLVVKIVYKMIYKTICKVLMIRVKEWAKPPSQKSPAGSGTTVKRSSESRCRQGADGTQLHTTININSAHGSVSVPDANIVLSSNPSHESHASGHSGSSHVKDRHSVHWRGTTATWENESPSMDLELQNRSGDLDNQLCCNACGNALVVNLIVGKAMPTSDNLKMWVYDPQMDSFRPALLTVSSTESSILSSKYLRVNTGFEVRVWDRLWTIRATIVSVTHWRKWWLDNV